VPFKVNKDVTSGIGKRRAAAKLDGAAGYQQRRKEIAIAAARVFNQRGLQGTTISAVAEELSIDRASLYYYISCKEELFDEVIREASEENVAIAKRIKSSDASPREKLRDLIVSLMTSYGKHYPLLYIYIRENLNQVGAKRSKWARQMKAINREYDDAVISIIEEGYADGSFRNLGAPKIVAYGILGMINWSNRWFRPTEYVESAEDVGNTYADLVIGGLESRTATPAAAPASASAARAAATRRKTAKR
jgi:TetR/AcrR family transcriptional regulator, cholesterol catabolism regulator